MSIFRDRNPRIDQAFHDQVERFTPRARGAGSGEALLKSEVLKNYKMLGEKGQKIAAYYEFLIYKQMGHCYIIDGNRKRAIDCLEKSALLFSSVPQANLDEARIQRFFVVIMLGAVQFISGDKKKGLARVKSLSHPPAPWMLLFYGSRGLMYAEAGRRGEAYADLEIACEFAPARSRRELRETLQAAKYAVKYGDEFPQRCRLTIEILLLLMKY